MFVEQLSQQGVAEAPHLLWTFCAPDAPSEETSLAWTDARTPLRTKTKEGESLVWREVAA